MLKTASPTTSHGKQSYTSDAYTQPAPECVDNYPEQRLWAHVIFTLVEDYEKTVLKATAGVLESKPVNIRYKRLLEWLRDELNTEWFRLICEHIDVDPYHIRRHFDRLDAKYGLDMAIFAKFEDDSYIERNELSVRSLRKLRYEQANSNPNR